MLTTKKNKLKRENPILELGQETLRTTKQALVDTTIGGIKRTLEGLITGSDPEKPQSNQHENFSPTNFTPLDTDQAARNYRQQDQSEQDRIQTEIARYFKRAKSDEREAITKRKNESDERKQQIAQSEEQQSKKTNDLSEIALPQGKPKKRMFSTAKTSKRSMVETRADSGKQ